MRRCRDWSSDESDDSLSDGILLLAPGPGAPGDLSCLPWSELMEAGDLLLMLRGVGDGVDMEEDCLDRAGGMERSGIGRPSGW